MSTVTARPPYVVFETRAIEDRAKTIETGQMAFKDVDFAIITPMGSKDRIEINVEEWLSMLQDEVASHRFELSWLNFYRESYKSWKAGQVIPESGTPLRNWPGISPAIHKNLINANLLTVEDVAAMNESAMNMVGMGARALKQRAIDWLENSKSIGQVSEQMSALKVANDNLTLENAKLQETLKEFQKEFETLKNSINSKPAKG